MPTPLDEAKLNGFPGNHVRSWHEADHLRLSPSRQPLTQSEHSMSLTIASALCRRTRDTRKGREANAPTQLLTNIDAKN